MPSSTTQSIDGLLWGAFVVLAVIGAIDINRVVSVICWALALVVALLLVRRSRRSESTAAAPVRSADDTASRAR